MPEMNIAVAQINPIVGDLTGNGRKIVTFARRAYEQQADLVVFPELAVTGYPPYDLLENPGFMDGVEQTIERIAAESPSDIGVLIGAPVRNPKPVGKRLYNSALLLAGGRIAARADKSLLPTYDVYDEYRYFEPATECSCIEWKGVRLGVHICEDMWNMEEGTSFRMYAENPLERLTQGGADVLISLSATPYAIGKREQRNRLIRGICRQFGIPLVLANQVGANTELIFDGTSSVHGPDGRLVAAAPAFEEALITWELGAYEEAADPTRSDLAELHDALVLGLRDYFNKTGAFEKAIVGLSGGMDSSLTCALAAEALGPERVCGVSMPTEYSSRGSIDDARALASHLDIEYHEIPVQRAFDTFRDMLAGVFEGTEPGVAEENLQARARGVILMGIANKFDYLVLATGNKSEMAVGYATLYGDMAGGLAILSDVYKTQVYELARYVNERAGREVIPENVFVKPPSAELRPGQMDQDTLPPYEVLDAILRHYIEGGDELDGIVQKTEQQRSLVHAILKMVDRNEFKRRQAPPGLRVSNKAFGTGRRIPIVMKWDRDALQRIASGAA